MARTKRSVTIIDVAKAAGVSVSTVSRVINDKDDVADETHQRVTQVIEDMGYMSSLAARSMRSRKTGVIGLIMPDVEDPYSIEVIRGVNQSIVELEQDLLVYTSGEIRHHNSANREQQYVALLNSSLTDGLLIVTPTASEFPSVAPVVSIDPNVNNPPGPAVISTNYHGAYEATKFLIDLGHRRIGFIGGRKELISSIRREKAFVDAINESGLTLNPKYMVPGDFTVVSGYDSALQLLAMADKPTAIFASNDQSAKGVLQAARELDIRVPDDLSLIGFDNIPEAEYMNLTTIDQFISEMGYVGTHMLIDLIQGEPRDDEIYKIETELVVRGSCRSLG